MNNRVVLSQASLYLILGIILGYFLATLQYSETGVIPKPSSRSCEYNGVVYRSGDSFPSSDGCNSCSCSDGQVACTLIACE